MIYLISNVAQRNIGDLAIHMATDAFFKSIGVPYTIVTHDNVKKMNIKPSDTIVLRGGGFFGLYNNYDENFICDFLLAHRKNKIVFLPNSLSDKHPEYFNKITKESYTIFARDLKSKTLYEHYFPNSRILMCPDIVMFLPKFKTVFKKNGIMMCRRDDRESNVSHKLQTLPYKNYSRFSNVAVRIDDMVGVQQTVLSYMELIAEHELVITDTLHVSIFCYLTNTPCCSFDTAFGKVHSYLDTYIPNGSIKKCYTLNDIGPYNYNNNPVELSYNVLKNEFSS